MSLVPDRILCTVISGRAQPEHTKYLCHILAASSVQSRHYMFVPHHPQSAARGQLVPPNYLYGSLTRSVCRSNELSAISCGNQMSQITSSDAWDGRYIAHQVIRAIGRTDTGTAVCKNCAAETDRTDSSVIVQTELQARRGSRRN